MSSTVRERYALKRADVLNYTQYTIDDELKTAFS